MAMLKSKGLLFDDEQAAVECLKIISYFRLANYWKPMESDKVNYVFKPKNKFALRTKVIQVVSSNYGAFWFANESLFSNTTIFSKCLSNIEDELKRSKEDFLIEHFAKYDTPPYPPAWKTTAPVSCKLDKKPVRIA